MTMDTFANVVELVKVLVLPVLFFILREMRLLATAMHRLDLRVNTLEVIVGRENDKPSKLRRTSLSTE